MKQIRKTKNGKVFWTESEMRKTFAVSWEGIVFNGYEKSLRNAEGWFEARFVSPGFEADGQKSNVNRCWLVKKNL